MATRTKPLISAAALASAAAVAVATPAVVPSMSLPSPAALSKAAYELTTFADVLSVPPGVWTDILFSQDGWGGVLSSEVYGPEWAKPTTVFDQPGYINPWAAYCDGTCYNYGITGALYLFADALINGNGQGFENEDQWDVGIVNYLFEPGFTFIVGGGQSPNLQFVQGGWSAASWYLLMSTIGQAIPELTVPIAAAYIGEYNISVAYNVLLKTIAGVANNVPVVGGAITNTILAYAGDLPLPGGVGFYEYGLSGPLQYWINVATGAEQNPFTAGPPAAEAAAAPAAAAVSESVTALASTTVADEAKPAVAAEAPKSAPAAEVSESAPAAEVSESAPAVEVAESTPAAQAPESTPAAEVAESAPAAEAPAAEDPAVEAPVVEVPVVEVPVVEAPVAPEVDLSTPIKAPKVSKTPVRDALEKVGKQINAAIKDSTDKVAAANKPNKADSSAKADSAG